ncbi:MAG: hypothetical protein AAF212_06800 [Verrucomicrobiota bacterium]
MAQHDLAPNLSGWKVVLFIIFPVAAVVGIGFIALAPSITAKRSGHLYVGIRFDIESTVRFMHYNSGNPEVTVAIYPEPMGYSRESPPPVMPDPLLSFTPARRGKNIFDTSAIPDGPYVILLTSPAFYPLEIEMDKVDGEFIPDPTFTPPEGNRVMTQFIGALIKEVPVELRRIARQGI